MLCVLVSVIELSARCKGSTLTLMITLHVWSNYHQSKIMVLGILCKSLTGGKKLRDSATVCYYAYKPNKSTSKNCSKCVYFTESKFVYHIKFNTKFIHYFTQCKGSTTTSNKSCSIKVLPLLCWNLHRNIDQICPCDRKIILLCSVHNSFHFFFFILHSIWMYFLNS